MAPVSAEHVIVVGAGAAGLMAARELARAGRPVTILEARARCGGRIYPLPAADFGYRAEGGPEYVHGDTPVTRARCGRQGRLQPVTGTRWNAEGGVFSQRDDDEPYAEHLDRAMAELKTDLPIAEFLRRHFAAPQYDRLRRNTLRMVEGYDAADPEEASTLALADEWLNGGAERRARRGRLWRARRLPGSGVPQARGGRPSQCPGRCDRGERRASRGALHQRRHAEGDRAILTMPVPLLQDIALPPATRAIAAAAVDIGFGNVVKILLRFTTRWWAEQRRELANLGFVRSDETIPVWWTQYPAEHSC